MGSGRRLGMILDREDRVLAVPEPLHGPVIEVHVGHLHRAFEGIGVHCEAVVLGGDLHLFGGEVHDRLVAAVMPELELEGAPAHGQPQDLVSQADAEDGAPAHELPHDVRGVRDGRGVPGTVGQKDAVRLQREDVVRGRPRGHHRYAAAGIHETSQDVELDAVIICHHVKFRLPARTETASHPPAALVPPVGLLAGHVLHEIPADKSLDMLCFGGQLRGITAHRGDDAFLGAPLAYVDDQGARVHPFDAHDAVLLHVGVQRLSGAPTAGHGAVFLDDETPDVGPVRFVVLGVDADVADLRIGHGDELTLVGRIGEDLLVSRHAGVEDDLPRRLSFTAEGAAGKRGPVRQGERGFHEMNRDLSESVDETADAPPAQPAVFRVPGPVLDEGAAADVLDGHEAPEAAVEAAIPVVPHDEHVVPGHLHRAEIVADMAGAQEDPLFFEMGVGILHGLPVDEDLLVPDHHLVARHPHHPLDEILAAVLGVDEHDHVAAFRDVPFHGMGASRHIDAPGEGQPVDVGKPHAVGQFVDQDVIADGQGGNHRARRDLESLHHEGAQEQRGHQGDDDGFRILPKDGFSGLWKSGHVRGPFRQHQT